MMQIFSGASSGAWFEKAQRFGKSFMLPIAVLPAAGLLLGIGGALSNPNTLTAYPFLNVDWLQAIFTIMTSAGSIVFANLSVLFAVGVAVGLAKSDKGTAGLAALLAFLVMNATINALLTLNGTLAHKNPGSVGQGMTLGIQTLETGVFGGVVIGLVTCTLHSRFNKVSLPQFLGFFSGSRFVPIISSLAAIVVGAVMTVVWPHFQKLIFGLGGLVDATGYLGTLCTASSCVCLVHWVYTISFICRSGRRRWAAVKSSTASWLKVRSGFSLPNLPIRIRSSSTRVPLALCPGALSP